MTDPKSLRAGINVKELRIGNRIQTVGTEVTVDARLINALAYEPDYHKLYSGIKVTSERLLGAGFEKDNDIWSKEGIDFVIQQTDFGFIILRIQVPVEFWHELQNIVWDLTKREI